MRFSYTILCCTFVSAVGAFGCSAPGESDGELSSSALGSDDTPTEGEIVVVNNAYDYGAIAGIPRNYLKAKFIRRWENPSGSLYQMEVLATGTPFQLTSGQQSKVKRMVSAPCIFSSFYAQFYEGQGKPDLFYTCLGDDILTPENTILTLKAVYDSTSATAISPYALVEVEDPQTHHIQILNPTGRVPMNHRRLPPGVKICDGGKVVPATQNDPALICEGDSVEYPSGSAIGRGTVNAFFACSSPVSSTTAQVLDSASGKTVYPTFMVKR